MFAREPVLEVEVLLCPSLRFAHCSVDTRRPVFYSLSMETCSDPDCLPQQLLALRSAPCGGVHSHPRQRVKVELQTETQLDLQGQAWTSCGTDGSPAQNCQEGLAGPAGLTASSRGPVRTGQLVCVTSGQWVSLDAFSSTVKKKFPSNSLRCLQGDQGLPK